MGPSTVSAPAASRLREGLTSAAAKPVARGRFILLGPIFAREWITIPRRSRHYVLRAAYLGLLWVLGLTAWQVTVGWNQTATLADNGRFSLLLFQLLCLVQLALLPFFAGLSAASAISQEKDRRTFILLLLTDLRSYEIVLGKLLGSLLQIGVLLLGMVPVLAMMVLLGGIDPEQVLQATLILAATAVAAGSVGTLVALWRDRTFQALALTVLVMVLYICAVRGLPALAPFFSTGYGVSVEQVQKWLDPLFALQSVLTYRADLPGAGTSAYGFTLAMFGLSVLISVWGIVKLRKWNPSGEPIMQRERPEDEEADRALAHAAPGAPRPVWSNPILWREMRTRAYGRRPLLVKLAYFCVLALVCYYALTPLVEIASHSAWDSERGIVPVAAKGLVPITVLSLLLVSAQAVTAITTERDTGALDLLLVTDLSPQEFIFGKLGGILYNTKEYLLPPLIVAFVYAWLNFLATPPALHPELRTHKNMEALVAVVVSTILLLAFVTVLGIHVALRADTSRSAILNTLATVFFLSVGTLVCIFLIGINTRFENQWASFILFIAAGIGGLWWVLSGDRPSAALTLASWVCPLGMFYTVTAILVAKPGSRESVDPLMPLVVVVGAFGFALAAMLIPLLSEFDVALGRTSAGGE
jgi:ABC-type transport system involved in multi-copper enzyme maturation permease subunit